MRYLVYSDVHGNLPAFEKMLEVERDFDAAICLGDLVNYGPWSNECVDLALSIPNSTFIIGNHEEAFIKRSYPGENKLVQQFFEKTISNFDRFKELTTFVECSDIEPFRFIHTVGNQYIYPDTSIQLTRNYFIGHSHHQFKYQFGEFELYNVGSVGQNRKFINCCNYAIFDSVKQDVELKRVAFDIDFVIKQMTALAYPTECIDYYKHKSRI